VYVVDSKVYKDVKHVEYKQFVGNSLRVKYSVNNPIDNQIEAFYNEFQEDESQVFLSTKSNGYASIRLVNGLYFLKEEESGKVLTDEIGTFRIHQDTLMLTALLKDRVSRRFVRNTRNELTDVETNRIYK
jgi:hypothetical protein